MQFKDLYLMQQELDADIHKRHNTSYQKTMRERTMAFLVELGEFANEIRCFKFWSLKGPSSKDVILEEYSDGVHFVLSLGLAIGYDINTDFKPVSSDKSLTEDFLDVYSKACEFKNNVSFTSYKALFESFLGLSVKLGYSENDIKNAYLKKNEVNHKRQENNY